MDNNQLLALAADRLRRLKLAECFDPLNLNSRPTPAQQEVIDEFGKIRHQYVTAGNQGGKSQLGARIVSWMFEENHPSWKRPPNWGDEPLLLIVLGRTSKQIEETLWKKISSFIDMHEVHEQRVGGVLQKVVNKKNKNTIIFMSHHNENEAREKIQSFVAHFVWLDEMPGNEKILEELHRRIQARNAYFLATFTPKNRNESIRKMVDASEPPFSKKYQFKMLDNPIYTDGMKADIMRSLNGLPEGYRNTILFGDWMEADSAVYQWDASVMVRSPLSYSPSWRHVESSDPALQSKFGFTLWAEEPSTGNWYLVKADYLAGLYVPEKVLNEVLHRTAGYNIIRRVADPHESWYLHTASSKGIHYVTPFNKTQRKGELIKNLQSVLGQTVFVAPWCTDFIDEIQSCQWSESNADKIINSSSYHLLDSAQYFVDCRPKFEGAKPTLGWEHELRQANEQRKQREHKATVIKTQSKIRGRNVWLNGRKF